MVTRCLITTAVVVSISVTAALAQTSEPQTETSETPVTLVGCLQREADYRRANDAGRGTVGTGVGLGNEYVLIAAPTADVDCATATTGADAYELTGAREKELAPFVGRRIEITGMQKEADTAGGRPTGGVDPLGQDLELFEVSVTSFRDVAVTQRAAAAPEPMATAGRTTEAMLPRTASPLALTGLIGVFALIGAAGVRFMRR